MREPCAVYYWENYLGCCGSERGHGSLDLVARVLGENGQVPDDVKQHQLRAAAIYAATVLMVIDDSVSRALPSGCCWMLTGVGHDELRRSCDNCEAHIRGLLPELLGSGGLLAGEITAQVFEVETLNELYGQLHGRHPNLLQVVPMALYYLAKEGFHVRNPEQKEARAPFQLACATIAHHFYARHHRELAESHQDPAAEVLFLYNMTSVMGFLMRNVYENNHREGIYTPQNQAGARQALENLGNLRRNYETILRFVHGSSSRIACTFQECTSGQAGQTPDSIRRDLVGVCARQIAGIRDLRECIATTARVEQPQQANGAGHATVTVGRLYELSGQWLEATHNSLQARTGLKRQRAEAAQGPAQGRLTAAVAASQQGNEQNSPGL